MESVQVGVPPVEETPVDVLETEHAKKMIDKIDGKESPQEPSEKKFADRFNTVEDLEKSYKELQREYTKLKEGKTADKEVTPEVTPPDPLKIQETEAKEVVEAKGLDFDAFQQEFQQQGELSEESFKKLEEAGIPKAFVDSYIEGQKVIAQQTTSRVYDAVGGEETYKGMLEWAKANLSDSEKQAFNRAVEGSLADTLLAVKGLHSDYVKKVGSEGTPIMGEGGDVSAGSVYRSWAEVSKAMSDPRYQKDSAYRADVERRLSKSKL